MLTSNGLSGTPIAIVGGGLIGAAWAALFVHHGAPVTLWDADPAAGDLPRARFESACQQLAQLDAPQPGGSFRSPTSSLTR